MAELEQGLEELKVVKQAFKDNFDNEDVSTNNVEFRNMPNLLKQMEKKLPNQTKSVEPTKYPQIIKADEGYKLEAVGVREIPSQYIIPTGTKEITENNEYDVTQYSKVKVEVANAGTSTGGNPKFSQLIDGTIESIEESDLAEPNTIRDYAFHSCLNLMSVLIPSNIISIGASAFEGCTSLQSLTLAEGVQTIGASAFENTAIIVLNIPSSVSSIGENAFAGTNITELDMSNQPTPPSVTSTTFPSSLTTIKVAYRDYETYLAQWSDYADKIVRLPAIPSTIRVFVNNYLGELVSGASVTISGNGQVFTGTTDSVGVFEQGDLQPATYTISVADLEGFKTPEVSEVVVEENTQNEVSITYLEKQLGGAVLGVSWVNDASTTMTRTDDAIGMAYSIDTSTGKITSDFDNVFPYNQMKRQVINGNTFVYVPAMWFRVITDNDQKITSVAVSEAQGDGDNWYQTRPFYYGAYGASSDGSVLQSVSGASRLAKITRAVARERAMAVGTGYHQRDLYAGTILMFLWWIEFATKNSGSIMRGTQKGTTTGNTDTIYNENSCVSGYITSTSQMVWHGIEDYIGNTYEWEDGITGDKVKGGKQYVSDDYTLYDDYSGGSKMSALSFNSPTTDGYCLEALGWDKTKPFLCQPIATRTDTSWTSGFCDVASTDNEIQSARGGSSPLYENFGVSFFTRFNITYAADTVGCRLVLNA